MVFQFVIPFINALGHKIMWSASREIALCSLERYVVMKDYLAAR